MFANFTNLKVFANIFLLNFHFLVLLIPAQRWRSGRLKHIIVQWSHWSPPDFCYVVFQRKSDGCRFKVFKEQSYAWAEYSTAVLECFGRMTRLSNCKWVCPLLAHWSILLCRTSTVATFIGKMGVASSDTGYCTTKLYIREGLSPFVNVFSWTKKSCQFANTFFRRLFPLYGTSMKRLDHL